MNFRQLVTRNVMRNSRLYASYFFSSIFSIMVFFIFALIFFHPDYKASMSASSETLAFLATISLSVSQVLVVLMSFVFLWYAFSVFLKGRKHHFSVYLILGMPKRDLRRMVFTESMVIALIALIIGMGLGTLFSKLVLLISQNILAINQELPFYFPVKPALLTTGVYLTLFILLSLLTTIRLGSEDLTELNKAEVKPVKAPVAKWYWALLGTCLTVAGYSSVLYFTKLVLEDYNGLFGGMLLLVSGVLLTVAGTYLLYQQTSVYLVQFLRRLPNLYQGTKMLSLGSLAYRIKQNAVMYFMITIVAAVALVAIGVTMALGGSEFGRTLPSTFAYTYVAPSNEPAHQKRVDQIETEIRKAGYEPLIQQVYPLFLNTQDLDVNFYAAIPASIFNEMAEFMQQPTLNPQGREVVKLARTSKEVSDVRRKKLARQSFPVTFELSENKKVKTTYTYSAERYSADAQPLLVVSDEFYAEIYQANLAEMSSYGQEEDSISPIYVIHYLEWAEDAQLATTISANLTNDFAEIERKRAVFDEKIGNIAYEDLTEEQQVEDNQLFNDQFFYNSLYEAWRDAKQANGMILFLSVLIGSVFFSFAACIIYFRLFGELEQDGAYHYSLYILGVSRKSRHWMVTKEMLLMYFIPVFVAIVHFAVAIYAFGLLGNLLVWDYFIKVSGTYLVIQLVFFLLSRWRYLMHLERTVQISAR